MWFQLMNRFIQQTKMQWSQLVVIVAVSIITLLILYLPTTLSIISIWNRSGTYAHGYLILPIAIWLVWQKRHILAILSPCPEPKFLLILPILSVFWYVSYSIGVLLIQQLTLVLMIPVVVLALLGIQVAKQIGFPLFFLLLAVPMGEGLVPFLIDFTADFTVAMVQLTGIPIYREGTFFQLPTGNWSVVEACSGVRYLIASFTLGLLYAYLNYTSYLKRTVFILFSIFVPIIANGLRAFTIVMIGHFSNMELATGVDHLLYGWVFFGIVIGAMFYIGSFWRDSINIEAIPNELVRNKIVVNKKKLIQVTLLIFILSSIAPLRIYTLSDEVAFDAAVIASPMVDSWSFQNKLLTSWKPKYKGLDSENSFYFTKGEQSVQLYIGHYVWQREGAELITSANVMVEPEIDEWRIVDSFENEFVVAEKKIVLPVIKVWSRNQELLITYYNILDGGAVIDKYEAKLIQAKAILWGGDKSASVVVFATPIVSANEESLIVLSAFVNNSFSALISAIKNIELKSE